LADIPGDMRTFQKAWLGRNARVALTFGALLLLPVSLPAGVEDSEPMRIGVLAKRGAERCLAKWGATAEYLTAEIPGYSFVICPLGHDEIEVAMERRDVDFVLTNPSLYVGLERFYGASRIVTLRNLHAGRPHATYAGVIFCSSERNDIRDLRDLIGKTFMAVNEMSFGGWQMAWRELHEHGINPQRRFRELRFGGTHDAVVYAVRDGQVDAGTVRADTLPRMAMEGRIRPEEFRVIGQRESEPSDLPFPRSTRSYPEWPLAKARHTSDELGQQVAVALMRMSPGSPAAQAARCAGWSIPGNYQAVHECLEQLEIGPYREYGRVTLGAVVRRYWSWVAIAAVFLVLSSIVSVYVTRLNRRLRRALAAHGKEMAERIRAEEALRKSEQLRAEAEKLASIGRLAAGVAHEINNPLTGVLTFAHLLRQKGNIDEQGKQDLDLIINETTRVSEIVGNLLDFARERPATRQPLSINDVVCQTLRLIRSQKRLQQITIHEDLKPDLPQVSGDENQLKQVLLNLALNACEAMPDGGTLRICTLTRDGKVLVRFTDTGHGIKKEHLDRIFEPFFSTKEVGKGTGLGLSVSYGIIQQHGGSMEVDSAEGKGTTFTIVLPSVEDEPPDNDDGEARE
jgi:two-component system sensor histidine kinase/response regulator